MMGHNGNVSFCGLLVGLLVLVWFFFSWTRVQKLELISWWCKAACYIASLANKGLSYVKVKY